MLRRLTAADGGAAYRAARHCTGTVAGARHAAPHASKPINHVRGHDFSLGRARATTTPADTCVGAHGANFLLGIRRGRPPGHISTGGAWRHECHAGAPDGSARLASVARAKPPEALGMIPVLRDGRSALARRQPSGGSVCVFRGSPSRARQSIWRPSRVCYRLTAITASGGWPGIAAPPASQWRSSASAGLEPDGAMSAWPNNRGIVPHCAEVGFMIVHAECAVRDNALDAIQAAASRIAAEPSLTAEMTRAAPRDRFDFPAEMVGLAEQVAAGLGHATMRLPTLTATMPSVCTTPAQRRCSSSHAAMAGRTANWNGARRNMPPAARTCWPT
jgi:hypothetical protein